MTEPIIVNDVDVKEQELKELKNKLQKAENNCIKIFNLFSELGEKYTKSKAECENLKKSYPLMVQLVYARLALINPY